MSNDNGNGSRRDESFDSIDVDWDEDVSGDEDVSESGSETEDAFNQPELTLLPIDPDIIPDSTAELHRIIQSYYRINEKIDRAIERSEERFRNRKILN